jgi:endoglucanase
MKNIRFYKFLLLIVIIGGTFSCTPDKVIEPVLNVSTKEVRTYGEGGVYTFTLECNDNWTITYVAPWFSVSHKEGVKGTYTVTVDVSAVNTTGAKRLGLIQIKSDNGQARRIIVGQRPKFFPEYNLTPIEPDASGMGSTATELVAKIRLGVNIGNTLELKGVSPDPTEAYIEFLKQVGFNAVRIPCAWHLNSNTATAKISDDYMAKG